MTEQNNHEEQMPDSAKWFVVHTYSGYENKVKANLEKTIINRNLHDLITEIKVPVEEIIEIKNGKRQAIERKTYPGYVLVKMVMTDETWYVVRNTRGVTGFVGPGSKPIPLTEEEVKKMGVENVAYKLDIQAGENVRIISGALENFIGVVEEVDVEKQKLRVRVSMFGRETPVEVGVGQIQKIY